MRKFDFVAGRTAEQSKGALPVPESLMAMRQKKVFAAERQEMGRILGITDESLLQDLQQIGYTPETVALVYFAPLVLVAWAEERLTQREHNLIFAWAEKQGIKPHSEAYLKLLEWLIESPGKRVLEQSLQAIRTMLQILPAEESALRRQEILHHCTQIARASGGLSSLLGLGNNVCPAEQQTLDYVFTQLHSSQEKEHEKSEAHRERKVA